MHSSFSSPVRGKMLSANHRRHPAAGEFSVWSIQTSETGWPAVLCERPSQDVAHSRSALHEKPPLCGQCV